MTILDLRKRTTMKIKSLNIADFNQFQNFSLDLTYPAGHEKAGEPLDKVCIIGQSGTGKTSLLRFMQKMTMLIQQKAGDTYVWGLQENNLNEYGKNSYILTQIKDYKKNITAYEYQWEIIRNDIQEILQSHQTKNDYELSKFGETFAYIYFKSLFIPTELVQRFDELAVKTDYWITPPNYLDLSEINIGKFWVLYEKKIENYQKEVLQKRNQFSKLATSPTTKPKDLETEARKLREWEESLENPLKKIGDDILNKLLSNFKLRVKTDVDLDDIGFLKIENYRGVEVPNAFLSTGTKQILLTALPIYTSNLKDALIFFDEPERSLYPDIQTKIVDFYTSLAPDSQFFFATHSPLVASSFDPWEIVELKFNEDGTVYQDIYYKGERHVDNYNVFPKRLDYSSILTKVFDLPETDRPEKIETLMKIHLLEQQIKEAALQSDKRELWKEYEKLADSINWKLEDA